MASDLVQRYGRTSARSRGALRAFGYGLIGGGLVGALAVGGVILVVAVGQAAPAANSLGNAAFIAFLAGVVGGVLGAVSGACAAALSCIAVAAVRPPELRRAAAGAAAAVGGGLSTYLLIHLADLLPDLSADVPVALSLLAAALDAAFAVGMTRAPRSSR